MKTNLTLSLIALFAGLSVSAQIEKGTLFVNGLNITSFQSSKNKVEYGTYQSESNSSSFTIGPLFNTDNFNIGSSPTINLGITNQLSGGISILLATISSRHNVTDKTSLFMILPTVRYYFIKEKKFLPFAEGKVGFGGVSNGSNDEDKSHLSGWYLGTGATYFLLPKTGIDFTLGYQNFTNKAKDSASDFKGTNKGINIGIGILVGF